MLLTLETTHAPATSLGYLLRKNPARVQEFPLSFGKAYVFYPVAREDLCRAALLLEIDTVELVRGKPMRGGAEPLAQYVNDRPYAASSFLSVAIGQVFSSAMKGDCKDAPGLEKLKMPLRATVTSLRARGGEEAVKKLFEPLGYAVEARQGLLDPHFPQWGQSPYLDISISGVATVQEMLNHLYVLIPALDGLKHYYIGEEEVEKLLAKGKGWLAAHPEKERIAHGYLRRKKSLARVALQRLTSEDGEVDQTQETVGEQSSCGEDIPLAEARMGAALSALAASGATSVLDAGCGEGKLLAALQKDKRYERIVGMDVSIRALEIAARRLRLDSIPQARRRVTLIHGSLTYKDARFSGFGAVAVVEVVEHLDPARLAAFERVVFEFAAPPFVLVTTPNAEYNVRYSGLTAGGMRHPGHRFEWTRAQFGQWAAATGARYGYNVRITPVGREDAQVGAPTQMALFSK